MDSLTVQQKSENVCSYTFDNTTPSEHQLDWLSGNRNIESFEIKDGVLYVTKTASMDWNSLNNNIIIPGLKRTFGNLKVSSETYASSR